MENQIITVDPKAYGLEPSLVSQIEDAFKPKIIEREALTNVYSQVILKELTPETSKEAGDLLKKLLKVRTGIAQIHQTQKAFFLNAGRFVDAWKNKETLPITQMEDTLYQIEKHQEILEENRVRTLEFERVEILKALESSFIPPHLGKMEAQVWDSFLDGVKLQKQKELEAKAQAEKARIEKEIADKAEAERIKKENAELKAKNDQIKAEAEAEAKRQALILKKSQEEAEAKAKEERIKTEAIKAQADKLAKEKADLEAKAKVKEKEEAEAKAKEKALREQEEKEKAEKERNAQNAPDKEKLLYFAKQIQFISRPEVNSIEAKQILSNVENLITKLTDYINQKVEGL
jgi:hypothetical protein